MRNLIIISDSGFVFVRSLLRILFINFVRICFLITFNGFPSLEMYENVNGFPSMEMYENVGATFLSLALGFRLIRLSLSAF